MTELTIEPARWGIAPDEGAAVHHGQARIAYLLEESERGRLRHVENIGWHVYRANRWVRSEDAAVRAVLAVIRRELAASVGDKERRKNIERGESAAGIKGALEIASHLPGFATNVSELDADPYVLNTPAGTLDLHTFEVRPHDPADLITKITAGSYEPEANSRAWSQFLPQVLPDREVSLFLRRVVGVSLLGLVREHVLPIWTGTGANGKGTAERAIAHALGSYAMTAEPDLLMPHPGAHPTGQMDLLGVRWCTVSESDEGRKLAAGTMKRLTGGDKIKARYMRRDFVEFMPSHTVSLVTNHLPQVAGDDPAIWRRIRVVPFDVVIPEANRDVHLDERLALEADAVLTWAVEGYRDYVARDGLDAPEAVLARTEAYRADNDVISRFISEECDTNVLVSSTTTKLHAAFERWARSEAVEPVGSKTFGQALDRLGFTTTKGTGGVRLRKGIAPHTHIDTEDRP